MGMKRCCTYTGKKCSMYKVMRVAANAAFYFLLLLCLGTTAMAQSALSTEAAQAFRRLPLPEIERKYSFIRYDSNYLHIAKDSSVMNEFFRKWVTVANTQAGNLSIMHIGSSHVQAGTFPHQVRTRLLSGYLDKVADRGLLFPYSAAKRCNNPPDYVVHCVQSMELCRNVYKNPSKQLGLCGIAVTAKDAPATIDIVLKDEGIDYATNRVVLLGEQTDSLDDGRKVVPMLNYDGRSVMPSYIDKATRRYVYNLARAVDSFRIEVPCEAGQMFSVMGVYLGNRGNGFTYNSIGVNGASLEDYLRCPYLSTDLRLVRPDLVIFGIGINDAHGKNFDSVLFKERYLQLCREIREVNPSCAFVFVTNNDSYKRTGRRSYSCNLNGPVVRRAMYSLAEETQGAVWDQFEVMGGLRSMMKWQTAQLAQRDKIHFTRAGYTLLGDLLAHALFAAVNDYALRAEQSSASTADVAATASRKTKSFNTTTVTVEKEDIDAGTDYLSY